MRVDEVTVCGIPVPLPEKPGQTASVSFGEGTDAEPVFEVIVRRRKAQEDCPKTKSLRVRRPTDPPRVDPVVDAVIDRILELEEALLDACQLADSGWSPDTSYLRKMYADRIDELRAIARHKVRSDR